MAIPDLIVDRIATPGVMAAKLLLPWGSALSLIHICRCRRAI